MALNSIYKIGRDGHFTGPPAEVECDHDSDILAQAEKLADGHALEIWDYKRFVGRISATPIKGTNGRLRFFG